MTAPRIVRIALLAALAAALLPAFAIDTIEGMPPVPDPQNLYSEATAGKLSPAVAGALERIYVPHVQSNDVYVIDPATFKVVDRFNVGLNPQHVVPSWDLKTLYVANNAENTTKGSLTPIDPNDRQARQPVPSTIRTTCTSCPTASRRSSWPRRSSAWISAIRTPWRCSTPSPLPVAAASTTRTSPSTGASPSSPASSPGLVKIDLVERKVMGYLKLSKGGMPQDIRISPDGKVFFVADMMADGIFVIDGASFRRSGS